MKDGGQAFPAEQGYIADGTMNQTYEPGMSLRDWFAGMAMKGFTQNIYDSGYPQEINCMEVQWAARSAYVIADAMLAERGKEA